MHRDAYHRFIVFSTASGVNGEAVLFFTPLWAMAAIVAVSSILLWKNHGLHQRRGDRKHRLRNLGAWLLWCPALLLCGLPGIMNTWLASVPVENQFFLNLKPFLPLGAIMSSLVIQPKLAKIICKVAGASFQPYRLQMFAGISGKPSPSRNSVVFV